MGEPTSRGELDWRAAISFHFTRFHPLDVTEPHASEGVFGVGQRHGLCACVWSEATKFGISKIVPIPNFVASSLVGEGQ